jgi:hypothetical protein
MSNAGARSKRSLNDNYPTPVWCARRLFEKWRPKPGILLEPCAGEGNIIRAFNEFENRVWVAIDIDDKSPHLDISSNLWSFNRLTDCKSIVVQGISASITNPPYLEAEEIIRHHFFNYQKIQIAMLLRVGFLESEKRKSFWEEVGMADVYILPNRPSFDGLGTDSACYAWFVWDNEIIRDTGKIQILNYTAKEERWKG